MLLIIYIKNLNEVHTKFKKKEKIGRVKMTDIRSINAYIFKE